MVSLLVLAFAGLTAGAVSPIPGVPPPPDGTYEVEMTKAATDRAMAELKTGLVQLEKDTTIPAETKREIKAKIVRLKIAVFTTTKPFDETVLFYTAQIRDASFIIGDRDVLGDARELAAAIGVHLDPDVEQTWVGKRGRSARWSRQDRSLEIDVEDTLIDPRDAKISKKTVVLVTYLGG